MIRPTIPGLHIPLQIIENRQKMIIITITKKNYVKNGTAGNTMDFSLEK